MLDGIIYKQTDGVSMGASLGPVLANIIMTEMERCVVDELIESGKVKFYSRYVDDTLLLVKPENVDEILHKFNSFHKNLEFTVDDLMTASHTSSIWKYTPMDCPSTGEKPIQFSLCTTTVS